MKAEVMSIRSDIGAAILSEGNFNTPVKGLTVFIRELESDGHIHGILVHDNRNSNRPTTYIAQSGVVAQTPSGPRLIMQNGTVEQSSSNGARLSVLRFQHYVFDLDQFAEQTHQAVLQTSERYLPELFWPHLAKDPGGKMRRILLAEGHNRLSAPLYCIMFALIAMAAVTSGRRARGAYALRIALACLIAGALRLAGYGAQGMVGRNPSAAIILYLIPLLGAGGAALDIFGIKLLPSRPWFRQAAPEPAG
jgi:lipopolysaccharide export system permease protein